MVPARRRQVEQGLEQTVDVGGVVEVLAAGDEIDALDRVVDGHRQVVAGGRVLAAEHHVTQQVRAAIHPAGAAVVPAQGSRLGHRRVDVEAPGEGLAVGDAVVALLVGQMTADAGIEHLAAGSVRGPAGLLHLGPDLLARAKAGIDQITARQDRKCGLVGCEFVRLPADRHVGGDAEPGEVVDGGLLEGVEATGLVDVLDAQDEAASGAARRLPGEQGRIGVADVQIAGGAGRETGDVGHAALARHRQGVPTAQGVDAGGRGGGQGRFRSLALGAGIASRRLSKRSSCNCRLCRLGGCIEEHNLAVPATRISLLRRRHAGRV